jgi:hypothetical protein
MDSSTSPRMAAADPFLRHAIIFAMLIGLQGCSTLYLHNAATQKSTDSALEAIDKIGTDAIFANESTYLDSLESAEETAVRSQYAAARDRDLLLFFTGSGPGGKDGLTLLKLRLDGYLSAITGRGSDRTIDDKLWRVLDGSYDLTTVTGLTALSQSISKFSPNLTKTDSLPLPSSFTLTGAIATVIADQNKQTSDRAAGVAANKALTDSLSKAKASLSGGTSTAATFKSDLGSLSTYLQDANPYIKQYASEGISNYLAPVIDAIGTPTGADNSASTKKAQAGIGVAQAVFGVGDAFSNPPRVPHPNALAATQAFLNYTYQSAATDLVSANDVLANDRAKLSAAIQATYYLSRAAEYVNEIAVPSKKHLQSTDGLAGLIDSKNPTNMRVINGALYYYAEAWNRGFASIEMLKRRSDIDERRTKVAQSRAAAAAWLALLKPGVQTLDAYGQGGIDPQTFAQLLQALGLGAIAVGVNK